MKHLTVLVFRLVYFAMISFVVSIVLAALGLFFIEVLANAQYDFKSVLRLSFLGLYFLLWVIYILHAIYLEIYTRSYLKENGFENTRENRTAFIKLFSENRELAIRLGEVAAKNKVDLTIAEYAHQVLGLAFQTEIAINLVSKWNVTGFDLYNLFHSIKFFGLLAEDGYENWNREQYDQWLKQRENKEAEKFGFKH
jgi:hypothetical protein